MDHIVYFTKYGNCGQLATIVSEALGGKDKGVIMENGDVVTPREVLATNPSVIYLGCPIRRKGFAKQGKSWLRGFAKELRRGGKHARDPDSNPSRWAGRLSVFYTHRFPEDKFRIEANIKNFLRGQPSVKEGKTARATLSDAVHGTLLGIRVMKVDGPLENGAADKVKGWLADMRKLA